MLTIQHHNLGGNILVIYDFPEINDVLPMHTHDETNNHISIVAKGSFKVHGDGWEKTIVAGNVVDWPVGKAHEFTALEANSRLVNIQKGQPMSTIKSINVIHPSSAVNNIVNDASGNVAVGNNLTVTQAELVS